MGYLVERRRFGPCHQVRFRPLIIPVGPFLWLDPRKRPQVFIGPVPTDLHPLFVKSENLAKPILAVHKAEFF